MTDALAEPTRIGPYRIRERIGSGGMGEVFLAEQAEPLRRLVAIKLIKVGMDTRAVLARFAAERQALALMSHPGIAAVHDAGATASGAPVLRDGVRAGRADHVVLRRAPCVGLTSGSSCSRGCATPCSTRTTRASCTAT